MGRGRLYDQLSSDSSSLYSHDRSYIVITKTKDKEHNCMVAKLDDLDIVAIEWRNDRRLDLITVCCDTVSFVATHR